MTKEIELYEGICRHLEPQVCTPNTQYDTKWESDNTNVATVDSVGNVTAIAEGTAHVTLTADGTTATCTVTVLHTDVVPNIESLLATTKGSNQVLQLNDAQAFFAFRTEEKYRVFVRDATRSIMLVNLNFDVVAGDVLNGRMYGRYTNSTEWLAMKSLDGINYAASIQVSHGDQPEPDVVTFDNLDSHHVMDYVKMQGVTLIRKTVDGKVKVAIVGGKRPIYLDDSYLAANGVKPAWPSETEVQDNRYDVEAIISYYNNQGFDDAFLLTAPLTLSEASGIVSLPSSLKSNKTIYNLQGMRVSVPHGSSALPKGVYIVDGKKVLIAHPGPPRGRGN